MVIDDCACCNTSTGCILMVLVQCYCCVRRIGLMASSISQSTGLRIDVSENIFHLFVMDPPPPPVGPQVNSIQTIVLAHPFGTDLSLWDRILPFLIDFKVIVFDFAFSWNAPGDFYERNKNKYSTLNGYVQDVLEILKACKVGKCIYVGHGISASIGILAAIEKPMVFQKLILIGASPRLLNDGDYNGGFSADDIETILNAMKTNYELWVSKFSPTAVVRKEPLDDQGVPNALEAYSRMLFNMAPNVAYHVAATTFLNTDLRDILGLVKVKTHLIYTQNDITAPDSLIDYMQRSLGGPTRLSMLNMEGHLPQLSAPGLLAHAILEATRW